MNSLKDQIQKRFTEEEMPSYIYTYPSKKAYQPFTDWKKACASWEPVTGPVALYIHIPFCEMKCAFCDLFTATNQPQQVIERYVKALIKEIELMKNYLQREKITIQSIYFGGGTPTLLSKEQLGSLLTLLRDTFAISTNAELSIEGAPNSFSDEKFATLQELGFTRVSLGIQSFDANELRAMGRFYEASLGQKMAQKAVDSGIKNVNLDLIYGIPGQDYDQWKKNLLLALEIGPATITTYPLVVRNPTTYGIKIARGLCQEAVQASLRYQWYDRNLELFTQHGYQQHTLVTYAKYGGGCQHEANEFLGMPTLAFGAGARKYAPDFHYVDEDYAARLPHKVTMMDYMQAIEQGEILVRSAVRLTHNDQVIRYLILGLLSTGIERHRFDAWEQFSKLFEALAEEGYAEISACKVALTPKGKRFSSHIGHFIQEYCTKWYEQEPFRAFWERGYRNTQISCMGGPSFEVAEILPALPVNAKVLDLGCGEGRNTFFLAQHGCEVTAVDRSDAAISKLLRIAATHGVQLRGVVQDIVDFPLADEYDLVMAHGVLYYLENNVWRALLEKVKRHTKAGGFNIFTLFVYNDQYPCGPEIQAAQYKHSFRPNELQEFYADWHELRYDQYVKWDAHPGVALHYHPIEKLVAQKTCKSMTREFIEVGADMKDEDFLACDMGLSEKTLLDKVGPPHAIDRMDMMGTQFGVSCDSATTDGYRLDLWYYGKAVIYLANGVVAGRALYNTKPVKLLREVCLIMGSCGSGKSTLTGKLKDEGYHIIAMGETLRDEVKKGTTLGLAIKYSIDHGLLLPDRLACDIFTAQFRSALKTNKPIAIEGFPSTLPQYDYFLELVKNQRLKVSVTHLECSDEVALERLVNRLTCSQCNRVTPRAHHFCEHCGAALYRREEDKLECGKRRLQIFKEQTLPMILLAKSTFI